MKFQNTKDAELDFSICGKEYKVPAGGEVEIEPSHVPYVFSRGLSLEMVSSKPKAKPAPAPEPVKAKEPKEKAKPAPEAPAKPAWQGSAFKSPEPAAKPSAPKE